MVLPLILKRSPVYVKNYNFGDSMNGEIQKIMLIIGNIENPEGKTRHFLVLNSGHINASVENGWYFRGLEFISAVVHKGTLIIS